MSEAESAQQYAVKVAEWMVQLNCWVWPEDMPGKPVTFGGMTADQKEEVIRRAIRGLEMSGLVDQKMIDRLWQDEALRDALTDPLAAPTSGER